MLVELTIYFQFQLKNVTRMSFRLKYKKALIDWYYKENKSRVEINH